MKRLGKYQRGASIWMVALFVIVLGFGVIFGMKLVPIYLEWFKVEKAVVGTLQAGAAEQTRQALMDTVIRRLDIDDVRRFNAVNFKDYFIITKKGRQVTIDVDYAAEKALFYNIYVVVKFQESYTNTDTN